MRGRVLLLAMAGALAPVACSSSMDGGGAPPETGDDGGTVAHDGASPGPSADGASAPPGDSGSTVDAGQETDAPPPLAVAVSGTTLVDGAGRPLVLHGVDHSGTEYSCIQNNGIFDGPSDDAMIDAIVGWKTNAVRVPLNEDCWLGINGAPAAYSGATYTSAIVDFVNRLHAKGLYAIVELHWSAPGTAQATAQQPMADKDHAVDFWKSVATAFAGDPAVVFDLFNEPFLDSAGVADPWGCWKNGCSITFDNTTFDVAGMQDLVTAVRSTGSTQPIMLGGLAYANDLSGWLAHAPTDPAHALVASFHLYNFNACKDAACWDAQVKPILATAPVVTGEIGEDDCAHAFIDGYMTWADAAKVSYLGWTWNAWGGATTTSCGTNKIVLVADFTGSPTPFGAGYKAHLASL